MIFSGKEEAHFWSACSSELFEPYPPQLLIYPHTNDWARSSVRSKAHQLPTTYVLVYLKTNTPSQGCQILQIRIHHLEHEQALKMSSNIATEFLQLSPFLQVHVSHGRCSQGPFPSSFSAPPALKICRIWDSGWNAKSGWRPQKQFA